MSDNVNFGASKFIATLGVIAGLCIALGVPALVLMYGIALGPVVITILCLFAMCAGGFVATVAAFFGIVIPSRVHDASQAAPPAPPAPAPEAVPAPADQP